LEGFIGGVTGSGCWWAALLDAVLSDAMKMFVSCRLYRTGEEFLNLICVCLYWDGLSFEGIGEPVYVGRVSDDECFKGITESFLDFRGLEAVGVEGQP
jgi:hypothetical protein